MWAWVPVASGPCSEPGEACDDIQGFNAGRRGLPGSVRRSARAIAFSRAADARMWMVVRWYLDVEN